MTETKEKVSYGRRDVIGLALFAVGSLVAVLALLSIGKSGDSGSAALALAIRNGIGIIPATAMGVGSMVIGAAMFLASPASSFISGQTLAVCGGEVMI